MKLFILAFCVLAWFYGKRFAIKKFYDFEGGYPQNASSVFSTRTNKDLSFIPGLIAIVFSLNVIDSLTAYSSDEFFYLSIFLLITVCYLGYASKLNIYIPEKFYAVTFKTNGWREVYSITESPVQQYEEAREATNSGFDDVSTVDVSHGTLLAYYLDSAFFKSLSEFLELTADQRARLEIIRANPALLETDNSADELPAMISVDECLAKNRDLIAQVERAIDEEEAKKKVSDNK